MSKSITSMIQNFVDAAKRHIFHSFSPPTLTFVMYSVQDSHITVQPLVRPLERAISQHDYALLQQLLQREKQAKEEKLREQLKQQYALQEQKQLELALYRLAYLRARERQKREEQIQHAIQAYRQKQLIRAVEEQVYRQKIAEALEQHQNELLRRRYVQNLRKLLAERRDESPKPVPVPRRQSSFDDYKAEQLCHVLRHCFGDQPQEKEIIEDDGNPDWLDEEEDQDSDTLNESLWERLTLTDEDEEQDEESQATTTTGSTDIPPAMEPKTFIQSKPEPTQAEPKQSEYEDNNNRMIEEQAYDQEHALQEFLRQLVKQQAAGNEQDKVLVNAEPELEREQQQLEVEQPSPVKPTHFGGFIPQDILTEAEPTPANEFSQPFLGRDKISEEERAAADVSADQINVGEVAKQEQFNKLASIEQKLSDIQSKHATQPLGPLTLHKTSKHKTSKRKTSKHKTLPATTAANKEFLQREEELVQLLLQLDAIDSFGQEDIRQRRKRAITCAEKLLQNLDNYKSSS